MNNINIVHNGKGKFKKTKGKLEIMDSALSKSRSRREKSKNKLLESIERYKKPYRNRYRYRVEPSPKFPDGLSINRAELTNKANLDKTYIIKILKLMQNDRVQHLKNTYDGIVFDGILPKGVENYIFEMVSFIELYEQTLSLETLYNIRINDGWMPITHDWVLEKQIDIWNTMSVNKRKLWSLGLFEVPQLVYWELPFQRPPILQLSSMPKLEKGIKYDPYPNFKKMKGIKKKHYMRTTTLEIESPVISDHRLPSLQVMNTEPKIIDITNNPVLSNIEMSPNEIHSRLPVDVIISELSRNQRIGINRNETSSFVDVNTIEKGDSEKVLEKKLTDKQLKLLKAGQKYRTITKYELDKLQQQTRKSAINASRKTKKKLKDLQKTNNKQEYKHYVSKMKQKKQKPLSMDKFKLQQYLQAIHDRQSLGNIDTIEIGEVENKLSQKKKSKRKSAK